MTGSLAEIIQDKSVLETTIKKLLNELEKKSGCVVTGICLDYHQPIGRDKIIRDVELKVELPKR